MRDVGIITIVLDKYFDCCNEPGEEYSLAAITASIPAVMLDLATPEDADGYSFWLPLKSTVTEEQLTGLELLLQHPLPPSFKYFLKERYFIDIRLQDDASYIDFFSNLPGLLISTFREKIEKLYAGLPERKYLPFAGYHHGAVLAFDANKMAGDNEYAIVLLHHSDSYASALPYAGNFISMFHDLDKKLDETIKQITNYRDNS